MGVSEIIDDPEQDQEVAAAPHITLEITKPTNPKYKYSDYSYDGSEQFSHDGNLSRFMREFKVPEVGEEKISGYPRELLVGNTVHVVVHSKIMQAHLYDKYGIDIETSVCEALRNIRNSNNWTFIDKIKAIVPPIKSHPKPLRPTEWFGTQNGILGKMKEQHLLLYPNFFDDNERGIVFGNYAEGLKNGDFVKLISKFKAIGNNEKKRKEIFDKPNKKEDKYLTVFNAFMEEYIHTLRMRIGVPTHTSIVEGEKLIDELNKSYPPNKRKFCGNPEKDDVTANYTQETLKAFETTGGKRSKKRLIRGKVTKKNRKFKKSRKRKGSKISTRYSNI